MKITKKIALKICVELWTWIAVTGSRNKHDWPGWAKYGNMPNDCPCCEYVDSHFYRCDECPLIKLWPGCGYVLCARRPSPYYKWYGTEKNKWAFIIAQAAQKELERLK